MENEQPFGGTSVEVVAKFFLLCSRLSDYKTVWDDTIVTSTVSLCKEAFLVKARWRRPPTFQLLSQKFISRAGMKNELKSSPFKVFCFGKSSPTHKQTSTHTHKPAVLGPQAEENNTKEQGKFKIAEQRRKNFSQRKILLFLASHPGRGK